MGGEAIASIRDAIDSRSALRQIRYEPTISTLSSIIFVNFPICQPPKPAQVKRARAMRRATTEAETRLWRALRHRLPSHHFRRQVPIGDYVVDFCCYGARLVIEVDGNQHGFDRQRAHDERRTEVLKRKGFQVIRFANEDVFRAVDSVLDTIFAHLENRPDQCEGR